VLKRANPARAAELAELAQADANERYRYYEQLAGIKQTIPHVDDDTATATETGAPA
jgi:pyruvate-ferredoxin/flavodoxin oxidoreductase